MAENPIQSIELDDSIWLALNSDEWGAVAESGATIMATQGALVEFNEKVDELVSKREKEDSTEKQTAKKPKVKTILTSQERRHYQEIGRMFGAAASAVSSKVLGAFSVVNKMRIAAANALSPVTDFFKSVGSKVMSGAAVLSRLMKTVALFGAGLMLFYFTLKDWVDEQFPNLWNKLADFVDGVLRDVGEWIGAIGDWISEALLHGFQGFANWVSDSGVGDAVSQFLIVQFPKMVGTILGEVIKAIVNDLLDIDTEETSSVVTPTERQVAAQDRVAMVKLQEAQMSLDERLKAARQMQTDAAAQIAAADIRREVREGNTEFAKSLAKMSEQQREVAIAARAKASVSGGQGEDAQFKREEAQTAALARLERTQKVIDDTFFTLYGHQESTRRLLVELDSVGKKLAYLHQYNESAAEKLEESLAGSSSTLSAELAVQTEQAKAYGDKVLSEIENSSAAGLNAAQQDYLAGMSEADRLGEIDRVESFEAANELNSLIGELISNISGNGMSAFLSVLAGHVTDVLSTALQAITSVVEAKTIPVNLTLPSGHVDVESNETDRRTYRDTYETSTAVSLNSSESMTNILQVTTIDKSAIENTIKDINEKEQYIVEELDNQRALLDELNEFLKTVAAGDYSGSVQIIKEYKTLGEARREIATQLAQEAEAVRRERAAVAAEQAAADIVSESVRNGENGRDGENGANGRDGRSGADGAPGRQGAQGQSGLDGRDGVGSQGAHGEAGANGADGKDGENGERVESTTQTNTPIVLLVDGGRRERPQTGGFMPTTMRRPSTATASQTVSIISVG